MKCRHPFFHSELKILLPCGQCLCCRIIRRRKWTARLILEWTFNPVACFVTLTYDNEHLPSPPHVSRRDLQLFLKRLRKRISPKRIRYFACGEYGDKFKRPHYHLIIFGLDQNVRTWFDVDAAWGKGIIDVSPCTPDSMQYVAGYVAKKYSKTEIEDFRSGEVPREFTLSSRKPPIGALALDRLAELAFCQNPYDVIQTIQLQGKTYPLDRFMRSKIRSRVMSAEYLETLKEAQKELMREELENLVLEIRGFQAKACLKTLSSNASSLEKERVLYDVMMAHLSKNGSAIEARENNFKVLHSRKNL